MGSSSYIDGDGIKRHRSVQNTGTFGDPHVADVRDATVATGIGGQSDAIATSSASTASVIGLIKGLWSAFGLVSQAADSTGTLLQRVRAIVDRIGSHGDAASGTGSIMAQLRMISESHQSNRVTNTSPIAISAAGNNTVITPTTGKSLRILAVYFVAASSVAVTLRRGSTSISGTMNLTTHAGDFDYPICCGVDEPFVINLGTAVSCQGYVIWFEV